MKLLKKRIAKLNNKGFSLAELVCVMAILGIMGTAVSGALMISADAFRGGNNETRVQEESQLVANQISDLLIDCTAKPTFDGTKLTIQQGDKKYEITYDSTSKQLNYVEFYLGTAKPAQLLAENIESFSVDVDQFEKTGNVLLNMAFVNEERQFAANYAVTSRNKEVSSSGLSAVSIAVTNEVILVPNETVNFATLGGGIQVNGVTNTNLEWEVLNNTSGDTTINNSGVLKVGADELASTLRIHITTQERNPADASKPAAEAWVNAFVRRVNAITGTLTGPTYIPTYNVGEQYTIDIDSIDAVNATETTLACEVAGDADLCNEIYYTFGGTFDMYNKSISADGRRLIITLTAEMPNESEIRIIAKSKHATDTNKGASTPGGSNAYNPSAIAEFSIVCNRDDGPANWTLPAGGWKRFSDENQASVNENFYLTKKQEFANAGVTVASRYQYRFKKHDEPESAWQGWFENTAGDGNDSMAINLRPQVTGLWDYDSEYDIEIRFSLVKAGTTDEVWPAGDPTISKSKYLIGSTMKKVGVLYKSELLGITNEEGMVGLARGEASISVQKNREYMLLDFKTEQTRWDPSIPPYGANVVVDPGTIVNGIPQNRIANEMKFILEKKNGSRWEVVDDSVVHLQDMQGSCKMQPKDGATSGEYRLKVWAPQMKKYRLDGNNLVEDGKQDFILYNESTGEGIFYFEMTVN